MNQIVKFISTINSRLNSLPVENGNLIFVEDARKIVLDFHGKRAEYTQFVTLESEDQRLSLLAPLDLFGDILRDGFKLLLPLILGSPKLKGLKISHKQDNPIFFIQI